MFEGRDQLVHELLHERNLIPDEQLKVLRVELRATGKTLADALLDLGWVKLEALLQAVAAALGQTYLAEVPGSISPDLRALLNGDVARNYGVIPVRADATDVDLLVVDPFNARIVDDLTFVLGREVRVMVGDPVRVSALLKQCYGEDRASVEDLVRELEASPLGRVAMDNVSVDDLEAMAGEAPVIRLVNLILGQAIREHASDVHFEPFEHEFKVRVRVDGVLFDLSPPPQALALPVISRIKVLANLNIAERRVPQDGRLRLSLAGRAVDLRVSTLPTQFGESVVLRVLDQSAVQLEISDLGMSEEIVAGVHEIVRRPNGIFIVTGPTGSGKTTTLYSALRLINQTDTKVLTAEDPVEYEIDGLIQVPVNPSFGLTFSATLRSFLRQDPDVIMVGEIRDLETAQIAVQASLTGHLVLSTLHTNDAPGAVTRLMDLGVEPFLIASTLEAVLAQRLVRRICQACAEPVDALAGAKLLQCDPGLFRGRMSLRGAGCPHCGKTGYRGRTGIYEWLRITESLRELVVGRAATLAIRKRAVEQGMRTLRTAGLERVFAGDTTAEEVAKYT